MSEYLNRVRQVVTTTGTGSTITLASTSDGDSFFTMDESGAANGHAYDYILTDGNDVEIHRGETWTASTRTFTRGTPSQSRIGGSAGTSKIDLSGSARLRIFQAGELMLDKFSNLSDLDDVDEAKTNLELGSAADENADAFATAAQGTKADSAVQDVAAVIHAATGKTTPVDADELALVDSAASDVLKKLTWANLKAALPSSVIPNFITGLALSTAGSSSTFSIASGVSADSTNAAMMALASAYTKTTSSWAVGSTHGALDTSTIANNTWYHVWLIQRSDTSVVDVLISTSATAPTMPTNYDRKRRIGSMKTNGSAQWIAFTQRGDQFLWSTPVSDSNVTSLGTTASLVSLTVPSGIQVDAIISGRMFASSDSAVLITSPDQNDTAPTTGSGPLTTQCTTNTSAGYAGDFRTDTSGRIRTRSSAASTFLSITTNGWLDARDK